MNTTHPSRPSSAVRDRGVLMDIIGFAPAPTLSRELFALVVNAALIAVVLAVLQPPLLGTVIVAAIMAVWLLGRLAAGFAVRGYARPAGSTR